MTTTILPKNIHYNLHDESTYETPVSFIHKIIGPVPLLWRRWHPPQSMNTPVSITKNVGYDKPLIPASYIFSYWILLWAIIYIIIVYSYRFLNSPVPNQIKWANPSLILLVAFIWNSESLIKLFLDGNSADIMFKYIVTILCIKVIPLYFVWTWDIKLYRDVAIGATLFAIYCIYLWVYDTDFIKVYQDLSISVKNNEDRTPFEHLVWGTMLDWFAN